ncbi:hypothetical protein PO878_11870 [Iamia majanohamensis]|uniref:Uncharacterized protein n=1 Tax=Iamia majanohamensis TaxID=467976 RepID=A0AAF0BQR7_9ACTN|nr:hypothetical protein [Iamia majanohamensis]WCO65196.1 hypothetical protein PO878_11870 [Iamia majanohamensis]
MSDARDLASDVIYTASERMSAKYGVTVVPEQRRSWLRVTNGFSVPELGIFQAVTWRRRWRGGEWQQLVPMTRAANAVGAAIRAHSG